MPRHARDVAPGYAHHVTQRGTDRQNVFRRANDRQAYLEIAYDQAPDSGVRILAYCLMTNHIHMVVVPEHGDSLAVYFRRLHGMYAQHFNARTRRSGHLWQARFHSAVLSPKHLEVALRYDEMNPVRAGMVDAAEQYRWSSAAAHLSDARRDPLLDAAFWLSHGGAAGWRALLDRGHPQTLGYLLRRCTHANRPFGDSAFLEEMEELMGRRWERWPSEAALIDEQFRLSLDALAPQIAFFA